MFGTLKNPDCSLRGAETNGFLEFLVTVLLPRFDTIPNHADLLKAGVALRTLLLLIRAHPRRFPVHDVQAFVDASKRYLGVCEKLGWVGKPKEHLLMHMGQRIWDMGSPALYGNWYDETSTST